MSKALHKTTSGKHGSTAPETRYATILDASESVFANSGFDGATIREIAQLANVAQGLIHYHFKTKELLFEAMVARRSNDINGRRAALLDEVFNTQANPQLETIVEALFRPTIEAGISLAGNGGAFSRILVSTANSTQGKAGEITQKYYDPIAKKYIAAFLEVEGGLTREDAVWAYMFAIGVGMTMMAKTGRPGRLSDGLCDDGDADKMLTKIVPFICAGIRALTDKSQQS